MSTSGWVLLPEGTQMLRHMGLQHLFLTVPRKAEDQSLTQGCHGFLQVPTGHLSLCWCIPGMWRRWGYAQMDGTVSDLVGWPLLGSWLPSLSGGREGRSSGTRSAGFLSYCTVFSEELFLRHLDTVSLRLPLDLIFICWNQQALREVVQGCF